MLPLPRGAVWQLLFLFCAALYINGVRSEGRVVCYYTNWSVYRPGTAKFNPQNINPYLCTHLIYAFGGFTKDNQMKPFDKYQDIEQGGYAKFTGLKTYNKQLKTMIAIGGWNEASSRFSPLVANPERRQKFIKNMLKFLRQNHFDGIDLDWEYPAHREGGKARDRDNYAQFVQELRAEFEREAEKTGRPRLLVTMAVPAGIEYIEKGYDIPKLNKYLDWFNVLTYDFHSSHEPSVNHHAPLYSLEEESEYNYDSELNIDYSIKFYLNAGADKDKLVLGIPTYGRSYTLINEESTEIGAPAEAPGDQGDATREKGYLAYYEICQNLKEDPEWTVVQPNPNAMGPYAYRRNQWVGYDDEAIVRKKAQYVVDNGLGGIMFWAIDNDDFRGTCSGKPYPLIEAAKDAMLEALGLGINEVSKPSAPQKPSRSRSRENSSSTRNRITTSEQKLTYAERKGSSKRTQTVQENTRNKQQSTTAAPLNIKLTEVEGSSLYIGGRTTTPPPPTTPDPGTDFKCEEEGFFQHPRDCKKYYWCLDSGPSGLGIVAHMFTCPSGLYFNPAADSCDFARNVPCKTKKSTTAAPVTSAPTTTTTTRPTSSVNRLTATPTRTSFYRTTSTTTTTTTEAPEEEETEYEEDEDNVPSPFAKQKGSTDKEAEEDPKVIKELIELIRKVGGIEELEKHLLRQDDGTIAIKENSSSSSSSLVATTPSSISKSLYEKVLSKPNALNSFRNRFTSTSSFRNTQTKTEIKALDETKEEVDKEESHEIDNKSSGASAGYSKYSSVVRGNGRQGPQNEGIEKLTEFEGFHKEKKQYTTINRNRVNKKIEEEDEEEESVIAKSQVESHEDDEEVTVAKTTKRPSSNTPSYSTIRRTRPSTTTEAAEETEELEEEKEVNERKSYSSLNRNRGRGTTTTEIPDVTDATAGSTRYKYLERTRPTRPTTESSNKLHDEEDDDDGNEDKLEEHENTKYQFQRRTTTTTSTTTTTTERPVEAIEENNDEEDDVEVEVVTKAQDGSPTTPPPSTTLLHIFTLSDDEHTTRNPLDDANLVVTRHGEKAKPKHKVVEINRIVEVNSKEEKLRRKSKANTIRTVEGSQTFKVESLPHVEQLGEISVVKYVHQVEGSDITIEGRSTVTDYTPTEPTLAKASQPVRNSYPQGNEQMDERNGKALVPEVIREAVESSTISLEGLFENARKGKVLNTIDDVAFTQHQQQQETSTESFKAATESSTISTVETTTESSNNKQVDTATESFNILKSIAFDIAKINLEPNSGEIETSNKSLESTSSTTTTTSESSSTTSSSAAQSQSSSLPWLSTTLAPETLQVESSTVASEEMKATTVAAALFPQYLRTPTTANINGLTVTRRPVLSVRRRLINTPTAAAITTTSAAAATATSAAATQQSTTPAFTTSQVSSSTGNDEYITTSKFKRLRTNRPPTSNSASVDITTDTTATSIKASNRLKKKSSDTLANDLKLASSSLASASSADNDITAKQTTKYPSSQQSSAALRRKFQSRRLTTTLASTTNSDGSATDAPRTQNPLFKRRYSLTTFSPPAVKTVLPPRAAAATTTLRTSIDSLTTTVNVDGSENDEATDQVAKSSIHTSRFNQITGRLHIDDDDDEELVEGVAGDTARHVVNTVKAITTLPVATATRQPTSRFLQQQQQQQTNYNFEDVITRRMDGTGPIAKYSTTTSTTTTTTATPVIKKRKMIIKRRPQKATPSSVETPAVSRRKPHKYQEPFERINAANKSKAAIKSSSSQPGRTYRPNLDYDYYDDEDVRFVGNRSDNQLKVILHGGGIIECLDQGNFPHPLSCRKFISCAKFETGGVVGWEYTCPKGLSYDPVGGMCNWAAGLGCKE